MSAGICGKRLGFEEIFGSTASPAAPAPKKSRCSHYGSPVRSADFELGSEEKVLRLLKMFPSMKREDVEAVINAHDNLDEAIQSLHALCIRDGSVHNGSLGTNPSNGTVDPAAQGESSIRPTESSEQKENGVNSTSQTVSGFPQDGSAWVDVFVQEMSTVQDLEGARVRVASLLEAFERNVIANSQASLEREFMALKEQLECLLRENHILKRAVAIQHERNQEHEEKLKEVEQLKHMINQYQEQVRTLEMNNYALKMHLQRAQEGSAMPNRFHPDIF